VPIIILFTLVNLIQQVGIISRISILLDRAFDKFGLSGRSVVNLMTGFGCNVPSILMARSSNSKKEKVISILISPFISCSARAIVFSTICNMIFGMSLG
jgi:ferrous iron transport protein B